MRTKNFIVILGLLAGTVLPAAGQAVSTQILGIVTDPTGAVIPGAEVKLTRIATGDVRVTATNETGNYIFPVLDIGEYEIRCSAKGFKTEVHPRVLLRLQDKLRISFAMQLGEQVEMIEVSSLPPLLHTDDATLGIVVDRYSVEGLPLNGRNFAQLATLVPGVTYGLTRMGINGQGTVGTRALPGQMVGLSANGQRDINQNITIDGSNAIEPHKNAMTFVPSIEAVQEFKVQSAVYSAEFGGNSGLQADVAIRSGANDLHGTAFAFLRNDKLDARGVFLPEPFEKNHLRRNQFGGVVSGPMVKDRTFWLASYEGRRERRGTPAQIPVPTLAMRAGDFSELLEPGNRWTGRVSTIRLPGTTTPLPNNIIPASAIDPVATNILTHQNTSPFPEGGFLAFPNNDAAARANRDTKNLVGTNDQEIDADQYLTRIDHRVSDNDRIFGRYLIVDSAWRNNPIDRVRTNSAFTGQNAAFNYSKILGPAAVHDFRFSWLRFTAKTRGDQTDAGFSQRDLGLDMTVVRDGNRSLAPIEEGLPDINLTNFRAIRSGKIEETISSVYELSDSLNINHGRHNFKLGGLYQWDSVDAGAANYPRGLFSFTTLPGVPDPFAAFMLGYYQSAQTAEGFPVSDLRQRRAGIYFLDDFKATPRLTINFGVRWDFFGVVDDASGRIRTLSFEPQHLQIIDGREVPTLIPNPGQRAALYEVPWTQVMPRLGMAYRLSDTWVLRAGAGQYYAPLQTNSFSVLSLNPPFSGGTTYFNNPSQPTGKLSNLSAGFASPAPQSLVMLGSLDADDSNRSHFRGNDVWQWTLELEKSLAENLVVGMAYLGSAASNLDLSISNFNNPDPRFRTGQQQIQNDRPIQSYTDSASPDELVTVGLIRRLDSSVSSNYNALQLRAEKRYSSGVTFTASFNYQKAMGIGYSSNENGGFGPTNPQDPRNLRADYGRSALDQRLRFVFSHVWEIPWMREAEGLKGALLGGWAVNGIVSLTSGLPVTVIQSGDNHRTGQESVGRPHIVHGESVGRVLEDRTTSRWFNTNAFVTSVCEGCPGGLYMGPKGYGNAGVGLFDAPAQKTWDFGLFKNFTITEGQHLQFRWEVFNLLNTPQFNAPNSISGTPTFGQISSTVIDNREMQFGLKYSF